MNLPDELYMVMQRFRYDPAGFVEFVFPWNTGDYQGWTELWPWHRDLLDGIGKEAYAKRFGPDADGLIHPAPAILRSVSSGTGTGKSTLVLPGILFWTMSVFPAVRGVAVSASRENLGDKFFADCRALMEASPKLNRYFDATSDGTIWVKGARHTRSFIFRTSGSVEALSGQHSLSGCTCVLFEESGGIADDSFKATSGARGDKQVIGVAVGQPTKLDGWFHRVCFGDMAEEWNARTISLLDMPTSTDALRTSKALEFGGEHTDDFRVFVLGQPRAAGENSFIARLSVDEAMSRSWVDPHGRPVVAADTPLVAGLDLARGGEEGGADNVMAFRAGLDGRIQVASIPGQKLEPRDRADWAIQEATRERPPYGKPAVCCYDATGLDGLFAEALEERGAGDLFRPINFGNRSTNPRYQTYRAAMWGELSRWMFKGGMLPRDEALARLIVAARADYDRHGKIGISPKKEMGDAAGRSRLDELDARLLSLHQPPVETNRTKARMRRAAVLSPGGFSLMG